MVRLLLEGRLVSQPLDDGAGKGYTFAAMGTHRRLGVPAVEAVNIGGGPNGIPTSLDLGVFHLTSMSWPSNSPDMTDHTLKW